MDNTNGNGNGNNGNGSSRRILSGRERIALVDYVRAIPDPLAVTLKQCLEGFSAQSGVEGLNLSHVRSVASDLEVSFRGQRGAELSAAEADQKALAGLVRSLAAYVESMSRGGYRLTAAERELLVRLAGPEPVPEGSLV